MEDLYILDPRETGKVSTCYRQIVARECFDGEVILHPGRIDPNLVLAKVTDAPVPILSLTATVDTSMRRNWSHIRAAEKHVYLIWLVRNGRLRMRRASAVHTTEEGNVVIFDSSQPFISEALVNSRQLHKSIFAVVPFHIFRTYVPNAERSVGLPLETEGANGRLLKRLLNLLYDEGEGLDGSISSELFAVILKLLRSLIGQRDTLSPPPTVRKKRHEMIEAYIDEHLTSRQLSAGKAADALSITRRYLSYLLKASGTNFTSLVNLRRQTLVSKLLRDPDTRHLSIKQLSAMSGYKSVAQFGRAFRRFHGCTPTEFRRRDIITAAQFE